MDREVTGTILDQEVHVLHIPPTTWWRSATWKLLKEYVSHNRRIVVPIGFISDGATIPFFLKGQFSPTGKYFGAAIIHDYIVVNENNWDKANGEFDLEMRALNVASWRRLPMVWAVKAWAMFRKYVPKKA